MDVDESGTIEEKELKQILEDKLGLFPGQSAILMDIFDQDKDGKITQEEFLKRDQFLELWLKLFDVEVQI